MLFIFTEIAPHLTFIYHHPVYKISHIFCSSVSGCKILFRLGIIFGVQSTFKQTPFCSFIRVWSEHGVESGSVKLINKDHLKQTTTSYLVMVKNNKHMILWVTCCTFHFIYHVNGVALNCSYTKVQVNCMTAGLNVIFEAFVFHYLHGLHIGAMLCTFVHWPHWSFSGVYTNMYFVYRPNNGFFFQTLEKSLSYNFKICGWMKLPSFVPITATVSLYDVTPWHVGFWW